MISEPSVRQVVGRALNFGSPLAAALLAASSESLLRSWAGFGRQVLDILVIANAVLAVVGSAIGVTILPGSAGVRISGGIAYGILAFFVYAILYGMLQASLRMP